MRQAPLQVPDLVQTVLSLLRRAKARCAGNAGCPEDGYFPARAGTDRRSGEAYVPQKETVGADGKILLPPRKRLFRSFDGKKSFLYDLFPAFFDFSSRILHFFLAGPPVFVLHQISYFPNRNILTTQTRYFLPPHCTALSYCPLVSPLPFYAAGPRNAPRRRSGAARAEQLSRMAHIPAQIQPELLLPSPFSMVRGLPDL